MSQTRYTSGQKNKCFTKIVPSLGYQKQSISKSTALKLIMLDESHFKKNSDDFGSQISALLKSL